MAGIMALIFVVEALRLGGEPHPPDEAYNPPEAFTTNQFYADATGYARLGGPMS
jgi:hypothetical protein